MGAGRLQLGLESLIELAQGDVTKKAVGSLGS